MGKLKNMVMGVMITGLLVGIFMNGLYAGSEDPTRTDFSTYDQKYTNTEDILESGTNETYSLSNTSATDNFGQIAARYQESIATAQQGLQGSFLDQISAAFGLISSLAMNTIFLFLAVINETVNFFVGIGQNLLDLPSPYRELGFIFGGTGIAILLVYLVITLVSVINKHNT